jgi:nucleotide-binding universal stress UspA family protein
MLRSKALKVLLAIDGSAHSEAAAKFVMELNWPASVRFEVLAVAPERWPLFDVSVDAQTVLEETANKVLQVELASAERIAARTAADLTDHGLKAVGNVRKGRASQAILLRADEMAADLIVVGARGLSAPGDFHLGSTAHQLASDADQAVLIVRPPAQPQPLSVILAADGSPEAEQAAAFLCRLALPRWAEVTIVSVAEAEVALPAGIAEPILDMPAPVRRALLDAADANTLGAAACLDDCAADMQRSLRIGRPAEEILAAASEYDADLIVLGARGHTRSAKSHLGGVAQRVVKYAPCSALIVR